MKWKSSWVCSSCGYKSVSQMGRCPECNEWNSMVEEVTQKFQAPNSKFQTSKITKKPIRINEITEKGVKRMSTGFSEVDRVLGGGMVFGSVILIAGEPGVGKSTLLLQIARELTAEGDRGNQGKRKGQSDQGNRQDENVVLYVSGEESESQIKIRYDRLNNFQFQIPNFQKENAKGDRGVKGNKGAIRGESNEAMKQLSNDGLLVLNETNVDVIVKVIEEVKPTMLIVDSVQTIYTEDLTGTAGSVGQVRESAFRLSNVCKNLGIPLFLVGQITKEGQIAGPKVLEHLVDVVLYFEGEHFQNLRILRGIKNRFGAVDETGIFEMDDVGLREVTNPSQLFLSDGNQGNLEDEKNRRDQGDRQGKKRQKVGAVVTCTLEGTRPILAEIQALTVYSTLSMPRRVFSGLDFNRCQVVLAVLQKYLSIDFSHLDVYVSVSGGLKIKEPAADLATALSLVSSVRGMSFDAVCYGEIGLLGDVRRVNNSGLRKKEIQRLGYQKVLSADEISNIKEVISNSKSQISKKL
jgi:DNA repair protein RadA/Sms